MLLPSLLVALAMVGAGGAKAPPASGSYVALPIPTCPGAIGDHTLGGPSNIGAPGAWVQGDGKTSFELGCNYDAPYNNGLGGPSWSMHVAWITKANPGHEFYGCGQRPLDPAATFVSADHEAYAGVNRTDVPALGGAAKALLADVERRFAKPCAGSQPTPPNPSTGRWPAPPSALVPIASVSNGCGPGKASTEARTFDESTFIDSNLNPLARSYTVNFREACNLHDAGYSGAKVKDVLHGGVVVDFFTWTKEQVDEKFLRDMILICERTIPASATTALANCKATGGNVSLGARSRYNVVSRGGGLFYRKRASLRGEWAVKGNAAAPKWAFSQAGRSIKAVWLGGVGGTVVRGEFRGTLISRDQDDIVQGTVRLTEKGKTRAGKLRLRFDPGKLLADNLVLEGSLVHGILTR